MKRNKEKVKGKGIVKKIVLSILGVFLLAIVLGISILTSIVGTINKEYKVGEIVIGEGQKTALVIYQPSKSNKSKDISMSIAQTMVDQGYKVTVNVPSKDLSYDWEKYDVIAFGSPIYMGKVSPVLKSYVERNPVANKKILIYAMGSSSADSTVEIDEMNTWVSTNNNIVKLKCKVEEKEAFENLVKKSIITWNVK